MRTVNLVGGLVGARHLGLGPRPEPVGRNAETIGFQADGHGCSGLSVTSFQILFGRTGGIPKRRTPENVQTTRSGEVSPWLESRGIPFRGSEL